MKCHLQGAGKSGPHALQTAVPPVKGRSGFQRADTERALRRLLSELGYRTLCFVCFITGEKQTPVSLLTVK